MATWNSRGLRGSTLEEFINRTCEQYREKGLALIQKVPTPITPVRIDQQSDEIYYMPFAQVLKFWERGRNGGLKHFKYTELEPQWFLRKTGNILVPFLEGVQRDLEQR